MLKTYLYIPDELDKKIKHLAKKNKNSKAEVIRTALEKGLCDINDQEDVGLEVLLKLASLGKKHTLKGVHDSTKIDEMLWDKDWSKDE